MKLGRLVDYAQPSKLDEALHGRTKKSQPVTASFMELTMSETRGPTFGQRLNTWTQTIGIMIAAAWAAYTFIYKEVWVPHSAPVNITVGLQMVKVGTVGQSSQHPLDEVQMTVTATNPSTRTVSLLPSAWLATGLKVSPAAGDEAPFVATLNSILHSSRSGRYVDRYAGSIESSAVAGGQLFEDTTLNPNETLKRTLIFYVPSGRYDEVQVEADMVETGAPNLAALEWTFHDKTIDPTLFRLGQGGERNELPKDENGDYAEQDVRELQLLTSVSSSMISLAGPTVSVGPSASLPPTQQKSALNNVSPLGPVLPTPTADKQSPSDASH